MGLEINGASTPETALINGIYNKAQDYASKLLNSDDLDFARYLDKNYNSVDTDKDNTLSKNEIAAATVRNQRNEELKKLLEKHDVNELIDNIDKNQDGKITKDETNPDSNVADILKSSLREIRTTKDFGLAAQNFTLNMCKNYYANTTLTSLATNAVSCLV